MNNDKTMIPVSILSEDGGYLVEVGGSSYGVYDSSALYDKLVLMDAVDIDTSYKKILKVTDSLGKSRVLVDASKLDELTPDKVVEGVLSLIDFDDDNNYYGCIHNSTTYLAVESLPTRDVTLFIDEDAVTLSTKVSSILEASSVVELLLSGLRDYVILEGSYDAYYKDEDKLSKSDILYRVMGVVNESTQGISGKVGTLYDLFIPEIPPIKRDLTESAEDFESVISNYPRVGSIVELESGEVFSVLNTIDKSTYELIEVISKGDDSVTLSVRDLYNKREYKVLAGVPLNTVVYVSGTSEDEESLLTLTDTSYFIYDPAELAEGDEYITADESDVLKKVISVTTKGVKSEGSLIYDIEYKVIQSSLPEEVGTSGTQWLYSTDRISIPLNESFEVVLYDGTEAEARDNKSKLSYDDIQANHRDTNYAEERNYVTTDPEERSTGLRVEILTKIEPEEVSELEVASSINESVEYKDEDTMIIKIRKHGSAMSLPDYAKLSRMTSSLVVYRGGTQVNNTSLVSDPAGLVIQVSRSNEESIISLLTKYKWI